MRYVSLVIIILLAVSCGYNTPRQKDREVLQRVYRMQIPNSSKVIYKYEQYDDTDSANWIEGCMILDSTETFTIIPEYNLPASYITHFYPGSNRIEVINLIDNDSLEPKKLYEKTVNQTKFKIKDYYTKKSSGVVLFYTYQNFTETKDSIFFEYPKVDKFGIDLPDRVGFRKGNIVVKEDSLGYVTGFGVTVLNQYAFREKMKEMSDISDLPFDTDEFTGESQIHLEPLSVVYPFKLDFTPDSLSEKQKVSNYGVYKRIK